MNRATERDAEIRSAGSVRPVRARRLVGRPRVAVVLALCALSTLAEAQSAADDPIVLRPGDDRVDSGRIQPVERLMRDVWLHGDGRRELRGLWVNRVEFLTVDGKKQIRLLTHSMTTERPLRRWDVRVTADTLEPVFYENRELGDGGDVPELNRLGFRRHLHSGTTMTIEESSGKGGVRRSSRELSGRGFDANLYGLLISAMPLADGFKARLPVVHAEYRGIHWRNLEVLERRRIPVGIEGQEHEVWIVKLDDLIYTVLTGSREVIRVEDTRGRTRKIAELIDFP